VRVPNSPLNGELTVVRAATEADVDLLVGWHADPEVARHWDDETFTREEILLRLAQPDVDAYVVEENGEPVGYIQAWFESDPPDSCGLDMFLIPAARGRGLGSDAARTIARWLLSVGRKRRLTVDAYVFNEVAVRAAWGKAGFHFFEEREADQDHSAPWLLMVMDRSALRLP
jgi:aminoglycoside 6'-N-acetyltransferase